MIHERFDLDRWKVEFPPAWLRAQAAARPPDPRSIRSDGEPRLPVGDERIDAEGAWDLLTIGPYPTCASTIIGPYTIVVIDWARHGPWTPAEEVQPQLPGFAALPRSTTWEMSVYTPFAHVPRAPTDLFVFARGEPERREITKIGGVPYWPAGREWPRSSAGTPMTFIAQFNFADSLDIVGQLPGDLLVIFGALRWYSRDELKQVNMEWLTTDDRWPVPADSEFRFEWLPLDRADLIRPEHTPATDWPIMPCHGQIYRAYDYDADRAGDGQLDDVASEILETFAVLSATKIGGIPAVVQGDPRDMLPGRYLCSIADVAPDRGQPYPYVNVPQPLGLPPGPEDTALSWGDCGVMHIFIDGDQLHWVIESH